MNSYKTKFILTQKKSTTKQPTKKKSEEKSIKTKNKPKQSTRSTGSKKPRCYT